MARLLALLSAPAVLMSAFAPAAPVPKDRTPPLYFPTKVGAKWVYLVPNGAKTNELTEHVTAVWEGEGVKFVSVARENGPTVLAPFERVAVSADGLFHDAYIHGNGGDAQFWLLKMSAVSKPVPTWKEATGTTYTAAGPERVTVPAGAFSAVRVEHRDAGVSPPSQTRWYAPGVGMVRLESGTSSWELKSFTPGTGRLPPGMKVLPELR